MKQLSSAQMQKLEQLWRSMAQPMRDALRLSARAAAEDDPQSAALVQVFDMLDKACLEPAGEKAKMYILAPLRPLTGDPATTPPSRFRFQAEDLGKFWLWLAKEVAPKEIAEAKASKEPPSSDFWHEMRGRIASKLDTALTNADRVPKDMTALMKRFGKGARDWLGEAAGIMSRTKVQDASLKGVPPRIEELGEDLVDLLRSRHEDIAQDHPDAALWLLLLTMGRMDSPWQIFRVVSKIARRDDDLVVQSTDLAAVGDALLADCGFYASRLRTPPADIEEAKTVLNTLDRYVGYSSGMTKEFGIRKDGRWGRSLFSLRAEASSGLEKVFEKTPIVLGNGLPEPIKGRSGRVIPAQLPEEANIARAEALLHLLAGARDYADAAAIGSSRKRFIDQAIQRIEDAGAALVDLVHKETGQARTQAMDGLEVCIRLLEAADAENQASLLRRRADAA